MSDYRQPIQEYMRACGLVRLPINFSTASREGLSLLLSNTFEANYERPLRISPPSRLLNELRHDEGGVADAACL